MPLCRGIVWSVWRERAHQAFHSTGVGFLLVVVALCYFVLSIVTLGAFPAWLFWRQRQQRPQYRDEEERKIQRKLLPPTLSCQKRRPLTPPPLEHRLRDSLVFRAMSAKSILTGGRRPRATTAAAAAAAQRVAPTLENYAQLQSSFFTRLPAELRAMVYRAVYRGERIHLFHMKKRLASMLCTAELGMATGTAYQGCWQLHGALRYSTLPRMFPPLPRDENLSRHGVNSRITSMLKTCRRMYAEGVRLLYTEPTFLVHHPWDLYDLSRTIPPHRFQSLRSLSIRLAFFMEDTDRSIPPYPYYTNLPDGSRWQHFCKMLAEIQGLRALEIMVTCPHWWTLPLQMQFTRRLLDPLKSIRQTEVFEVGFPYQLREADLACYNDAPFCLRTP